MRVRAHAIREKGGRAEPFVYEKEIGGHDVLVRITHCSVTRGDIQFMNNDWGDARFPLVPGHEIVGIVEEVGVGYQQEACFECSSCKKGIEQLCPSQKVISADTYGGFADTSSSTAGSRSGSRHSSTRLDPRIYSRPA